MDRNSLIYVAGHTGLVGSAIVRRLKKEGFNNLLLRTSRELDLRNQEAVEPFFKDNQPEYVFLCAATVGGVADNVKRPGAYIMDNILIQANVIHYSYLYKVKKLLLIGSSYLYPENCPQPIKEEYLLTGPFEPTKEFYSLAKTVGVKMCESYGRQYGCCFFAAMPPNLYGPGDKYDLESAHVVAALMRRFYEANQKSQPEIIIAGTGQARREFLHVDDLADACVFLMRHYQQSGWINCGSGEEVSIKELAEMIQHVTGSQARIVFDPSRPEGAARRLLDSSRLASLGWKPSYSLKQGLEEIYHHHFLHDLQKRSSSPS